MADWSNGYVADATYTLGYYNELNPQRIKFALLSAGYSSPEIATACELGFGQGISLNLHAAGSEIQWCGTDFLTSHAFHARELAKVSGISGNFFDDSFLDFSKRTDIPPLDFIALHGVWSWVSDENRKIIVEFIRKKLKLGGVVYISYNIQPGWNDFIPIRYLMTQYADLFGEKGSGTLSKIESALKFLDDFNAVARLPSKLAQRISKLKNEDKHYLAHEFFNRNWDPMYFDQISNLLEGAKLEYACSADYLNHIESINFTVEQKTFLQSISDKAFKEVVGDFITAKPFRKDYWVRGLRKLGPIEIASEQRLIRLIKQKPRKDISLKSQCVLGEISLAESIYQPILDVFDQTSIITIGEIEQKIRQHQISFDQLIQALTLLLGRSDINFVQPSKLVEKAKKQTDKLNAYLINTHIACLASPVTGGGVSVNRIQKLFILSFMKGQTSLDSLVAGVLKSIESQGQKFVKQGKVFDSLEETKAEITKLAAEFLEFELPVFKALKLI